jgi:hypothetical protein
VALVGEQPALKLIEPLPFGGSESNSPIRNLP